MRRGGGSELSRICALVLSTTDISKPPSSASDLDAILFQISPASNKRFVQYVQSLRRKKRYIPSQFQSESKTLLRLFQQWKPFVTTQQVVLALPDSVIKETERLSAWVKHLFTEQEVTRLRQRFGYPYAWQYPIRDYFITGRMPRPSFKARIDYHDAPHFSEAALSITIDGSTTLHDIISRPFWNVVESYQTFLADPQSTRQRVRNHTPLQVTHQDEEIRLRVFADTTQAVVKQHWKTLGIPQLQETLCGAGLKARKSLGPDMISLLNGENPISDPERARVYRFRLKQKGLR